MNNRINELNPFSEIQKKIDYSPFRIFLTTPFLLIYFLIARKIFGLHSILVIFLILLLLVMRSTVEKIAFTFFFLSVLVYLVGTGVEANYYMSFVYGFICLSVLKYAYIIFVGRLKKDKS